MSAATQERRQPLLPPDEKFWERYSAHHEFPLAAMISLFAHAVVIGTLVVAALLMMLRFDSESDRPPNHDVVQISGGGDGFGGESGETGFPRDNAQTEAAPNPMSNATETTSDPVAALNDVPKLDLSIPEFNFPETKSDVNDVLANLAKEADKQANTPNPASKKNAAQPSSPGTANKKGVGGNGGFGAGIGKGKKGTGTGVGGPVGRIMSKAQIHAWRWKFGLGRNAKEHVDQLRAIGFDIVLKSPGGEVFLIKNLNRIPVELAPADLRKFKDSAQWENTRLESLVGLAKEIQLRFVPAQVLMCLPLDREEQIAGEELRFARAHNNKLENVRESHFIFELRNGIYVPEATMQINHDGRVVAN